MAIIFRLRIIIFLSIKSHLLLSFLHNYTFIIFLEYQQNSNALHACYFVFEVMDTIFTMI